jgi:hypothetical protein
VLEPCTKYVVNVLFNITICVNFLECVSHFMTVCKFTSFENDFGTPSYACTYTYRNLAQRLRKYNCQLIEIIWHICKHTLLIWHVCKHTLLIWHVCKHTLLIWYVCKHTGSSYDTYINHRQLIWHVCKHKLLIWHLHKLRLVIRHVYKHTLLIWHAYKQRLLSRWPNETTRSKER